MTRGDPATDDQVLSFDGSNLSISGGNTVNLSTLVVPHQLTVVGDTLSITVATKWCCPTIFRIYISMLNIPAYNKTARNTVDLSKYLDNTDRQILSF